MDSVLNHPAGVLRGSNAVTVLLPEALELATVKAGHAQLLAAELVRGGEVLLDGCRLERIDTAGVQLLVAFIHSAGAQGCRVSWVNFPLVLFHAAEELGLADCLGD